jgi:hypothetical protein
MVSVPIMFASYRLDPAAARTVRSAVFCPVREAVGPDYSPVGLLSKQTRMDLSAALPVQPAGSFPGTQIRSQMVEI